jgi:hypothetical protein
MKRRQFLSTLTSTAALGAAALAGVRAPQAFAAPAGPPVPAPGADVVVRPESPLVLDGSADLGAVELRGGQIVTHGGGVINIARLTKG